MIILHRRFLPRSRPIFSLGAFIISHPFFFDTLFLSRALICQIPRRYSPSSTLITLRPLLRNRGSQADELSRLPCPVTREAYAPDAAQRGALINPSGLVAPRGNKFHCRGAGIPRSNIRSRPRSKCTYRFRDRSVLACRG